MSQKKIEHFMRSASFSPSPNQHATPSLITSLLLLRFDFHGSFWFPRQFWGVLGSGCVFVYRCRFYPHCRFLGGMLVYQTIRLTREEDIFVLRAINSIYNKHWKTLIMWRKFHSNAMQNKLNIINRFESKKFCSLLHTAVHSSKCHLMPGQVL